ncbi:MAG TPA: hypothetical protein VNR59_05320 [Gaiellaceae bacterium]|jgi:hypothetical protein|nr:hypothetical protein [Gaiellaceae bacterium]
MAFRPESTLNPKTLRREAIQLAIVAVISIGIYFTDVRALQIVVGVVDMFACVITAIAATVAWRVGGRGASVGLYAVAAPVFAAIAILNFA